MFSDEEFDALFGNEQEEPKQPINNWDSIITREAQNYPNIPENVVRSLITQESGGDPLVDIDTKTKHGYARGLGQFIDSTAKQYIPDWKSPADSYDPEKSIKGIYNYLNDLYGKTGSLKKALVKYHGGSEESKDILGKSSGEYAEDIIGRSGMSFNGNVKIYSDDEFDKFFSEEPTQSPTQKQQETTPFIPGEEPVQQQEQPTAEPAKGFFNQLLATPGAAVRGTWEGIIGNLSSALNAESAKQGAGNKLWDDFVKQRGGNVKKVIDPTTGEVQGDVSKDFEKTAAEIKKLVPKDWKEYDEKLMSGGKEKYLNPEMWTNSIFKNIPNYIQSLANGPLAPFSMAGTEKGAFVERVREIEKATGKKIDPVLVNKYGDYYGSSAGLMESVSSVIELGPFKGIGKDFKKELKKSLVKRVGKELTAMGIDGATETAQTLDEYAILGKLLKEAGYSEENVKKATSGWKEEALDSFILGFGTAGAMRGAGHVASKLTQQPTAEQKAKQTPSTVAEQTQPTIEPTPEMAGAQPTEAYFGLGNVDTFIEEFNKQDEMSKEYMLGELTPDEYTQFQAKIEAMQAPSTGQPTETMPTEEVVSEQPQIAPEEVTTQTPEIPVEEESKEAGQTLLTDTAVEQPTAESTPFIMEDLPETSTEIAPGMIAAYEQKSTPITEEFKEKVKSGAFRPGEAATISDIDKFNKEPIEEPIIEQPKEEKITGTKTVYVLDNVLNRANKITTDKEDTKYVEDVEFVRSIHGNRSIDNETGKETFVEPLLEFKDKITGKTFTVPEIGVARGDVRTEVDKLRANIKAEEIKNDKENQVGIRSDKQQGETTVKEEPVKETGSGKIEIDRVLQAPEQKVTKAPEPVAPKVTPKKDVTKYTFDELKTLYETDNSKKKKLRTLASEAGVKVKQGETWQSIIANYAEMHGTPEDKAKAEKFYKQSHSVKTKKSIAAAQEKRVEETGTAKTGESLEKYKFLKKMEDGNVIIYDPDPKKGQGKYIDSIIEDPKKPGKYKIVPTEGNGQLRYAIDVIKGKNGFALQMSDRGLQMIEQSRSGKGEFVRYDETVKYNDTEEEDLRTAALEEEPIKEVDEDTGIEYKEQPGSNRDISYKKTMDKLNDMLSKKKITKEQYKVALDRINEEFDEDTRYSRTEAAPSLSKIIIESDPNELQVIEGTQEDLDNGNKLANSNKNIKFNGIQPGFSKGGKVSFPAFMMFTFEDPTRGTTFTLPLGSTQKDLDAKMNTKMREYDVVAAKKEVAKLFKDFKEIPDVQVSNKLNENELGKITTNERGKQIVLINSNIESTEILPTLIHELIGHFGADNLFAYVDPNLQSQARDIFEKDRNSKFTKKIEEDYADQIEKNKDVLFEEWFAGRAGQILTTYFDDNGKFNEAKFKADEGILHKVYSFIETLTKKIWGKWIGTPATDEEIQDIVKAVAQRLGDIKSTTPVKQETRYAKVQSRAEFEADLNKDIIEEMNPTKRKAPKQLTKKEKLATYVSDRLKLETAKDVKQLRMRFFNFANRHFFRKVGGVSPESYRKQIFDMAKKVKELNDDTHKKILSIIDEFSDYMDAAKAYDEVRRFKKYNYKILDRSNKSLNEINGILGDIDFMYKSYVDYNTLKRLIDRGNILRPINPRTGELTNPSPRYQRLIEGGYIDAEVTNKDGETFYSITDEGKKHYKDLKDDLTIEVKTKDDKTIPVMFNYGVINTKLAKAKELMADKVRKDVRDIKDSKELKKVTQAKEIIDRLNEIDKKGIKEIKGSATNTVLRAIKKGDLTTSNLEFLLNSLDESDNGPLTKYIFKVLDDARTDTLRYGQKMTDFLQEQLKDIPKDELRSYSESFNGGLLAFIAGDKKRNTKKTNFKLADGKKVELTPTQRISISMISENEDGLRHLLGGGMSLSDNGEVYKLSPKDIENIQNSLTANEKKVMNTIFKYYEMQGEAINEISNKDIGFDLAGVTNYHPLKVRGDSITSNVEDIKNLNDLTEHLKLGMPGNLKQRTKSDAPLVIEGAFEALTRTSDLVDKYIGQAIPTKEVERLLKDNDLQQTMINKGLDIEYKTIRKLFEEFQKPATYRSGTGDKIIRAIMNKFTVATLGFKIPTAAMQLPSISLYFNEIDTSLPNKEVIKEFFKNLKKSSRPSDEVMTKVEDLIYKYSPQIRNRYEGHFDRDWGEANSSASARNKFMGKETRLQNFLTSSEGAMSMISKMDKLMVTQLWKLAEAEENIRGKYEKESDAYYNAVAKRTEFLVRRTQSTYDVLDRPLITSSNAAFKALTMFTSQPIKMLMMVRRSIQDVRSGDKKRVRRGTAGLVNVMLLQPLMVEAIRLSWTALRGKVEDDEWKSVWFWLKKLVADNAQLYPVVGSMIGSAIQGFDVNFGGPPQEFITRSMNIGKAIYDNFNEGPDTEKILKASSRLLDIVLPVKGIQQQGEVIYNLIKAAHEKYLEVKNGE